MIPKMKRSNTRTAPVPFIAGCLTNLVILWIILSLMACRAVAQSEPVAAGGTAQAVDRGIRYLIGRQAADDRWHSPNYGNLKQGAGITALVVYSIGQATDRLSDPDRKRLQAGVAALLPAIREQGFVSNPEGPDYSNYGSALLLAGCQTAGLEMPDDVARQLVAFLVRAQLDREEGFDDSSPDYGGWDLTGWMTGKRPTTGTNVSVTAVVLEALHGYPDEPGVAQALSRARPWLARCQNGAGDGGFFFHPRRDHDGNKAGWLDDARDRPRSYGSATADGIRGLRFAGARRDSEPVREGLRWLARNGDWRVVPGFENNPDGRSWQTGLRYYYYSSLSALLDWMTVARAEQFASAVGRQLLDEQRADGSWSNPQARMREDDPVIATSFAIITLARILKRQNR